MRSQHPGISQPPPRQRPGYDDMQSWQQQLMFKQLQEFQRQQQLRQLTQEPKQQNLTNQMLGVAKQTAVGQLPTLVNGLHDASNNSWQTEFTGNEPKIPNSSQMFMAGNSMNLAQCIGSAAMHGYSNGLMLSQDQGQSLQSMGFVPQQVDQSLYGVPVSGSRGSLAQYTQFQGVPQDFSGGIAKAGSNQPFNSFQSNQNVYSDQSSLQQNFLASKQDIQGKRMFGHIFDDNEKNSSSGNFEQVSTTARRLQVQEFHARQDQSAWQGSFQEMEAPRVSGPVCVGLDPTEQKILFSSDDDTNWDSSFGMSGNMMAGGHLHGTPLEGNESFSSFQGGSWSALMQSAVAEVSSSDTGLQDEWSGLSFQKADPPSGNHTPILGDTVKLQTGWFDNNINGPSSLASRHVSAFDNCGGSTCDPKRATFKQTAAEFSSNRSERAQVVASQEPLQQSSADFSSQNMHPSLTEQQNMLSYTSNIPFNNKGDTWNANDSRSSNAEASFKVSSIEMSTRHGHMNDSMRSIYAERTRGTGMWNTDSNQATVSFPNSSVGLETIKSGVSSPLMQVGAAVDLSSSKRNKESNQHGFNQRDYDQRKHVFDSSQNSKAAVNLGDSQLSPRKSPQAWESFMSNSDKVSGDTYDRDHAHGSQKEVSTESYISNHSHHDHSSDSGGVVRTGADSRSFVANHHKSQGQAGQQIPIHQRFHYHPMGNLGMVAEVNDPRKQALYTQGLSRMSFRESNGQDQGYAQHAITSSAMDVVKNDVNGPQVNAKGAADMHPTSNINNNDLKGSASFDGSTFTFPQTKRSEQASQNMLELLHKVDQSRGDAVAGFGFAGESMMSQRNGPMISNDNSNLPHNQNSSLQGIGLRLAPPSDRASVLSNASSSHFTSQTVNENAGHLHPESGDQRRTLSKSAAPVQSSPFIHETSRRDDCNDQSTVSRQTSKETSESKMQSNFMGQPSTTQSHAQTQLQQQVSGANMHISRDQSLDFHSGTQHDSEIHAKHASYHKQPSDSLDTSVVKGSSRASLPGVPSRVPPFRLASPPDIRSNVGQQSYPGSIVGQPLQVNSGSNIRNTGQQFPMSEQCVSSQPLSSGTAQHLGFSGISRNVWTSVSAQHLSNNLLQKAIPNSLQSIHPNNLSMSSWVSRKTDFQDHSKGGNAPPEFVASVNSQNKNYAEGQPGKDDFKQLVPPRKVGFASPKTSAPDNQEQLANQASDGGYTFASPSFAQLDQKDRDKQVQSSFTSQQREQLAQNRESHAFTLRPSDVQNRNFSLLQQVQAMKALEADPNSRIGKRLKGTDFNATTTTVPEKVPQSPQAIYGYGGVRVPAENELSAVVQCSSFPSETRMLSFSSGGSEGLNASKPVQIPGRELSSQDVGNNSGPSDSQSSPHTMGIASSPFPSVGAAEHARISPQMAPSWFGQYGPVKSGNMLAMYNGHGSLHKDAKPAGDHYLIPKDTSSMGSSGEIGRKNETSQIGYMQQNAHPIVSTNDQASSHQNISSEIIDPNLIPLPKKRKSVDLLPWDKEVTGGSHWMRSIRLAETDWAKATNSLVEKVEDESEMNDEGSLLLRPRRRLILTTQLMQQLLPSMPAEVLSEPATTCYEKVIYLFAKLGLGDACGFLSYMGNDARGSPDAENMTSGKSKISERWGEERFAKVLDSFLRRAKKMETDLLRFDKRTSILDIRVECQDLERFSIINRFAKFHGRSQTDGVEGSSTSEIVCKSFPQRYVTALSVPIKLPEGVVCLSL